MKNTFKINTNIKSIIALITSFLWPFILYYCLINKYYILIPILAIIVYTPIIISYCKVTGWHNFYLRMYRWIVNRFPFNLLNILLGFIISGVLTTFLITILPFPLLFFDLYIEDMTYSIRLQKTLRFIANCFYFVGLLVSIIWSICAIASFCDIENIKTITNQILEQLSTRFSLHVDIVTLIIAIPWLIALSIAKSHYSIYLHKGAYNTIKSIKGSVGYTEAEIKAWEMLGYDVIGGNVYKYKEKWIEDDNFVSGGYYKYENCGFEDDDGIIGFYLVWVFIKFCFMFSFPTIPIIYYKLKYPAPKLK